MKRYCPVCKKETISTQALAVHIGQKHDKRPSEAFIMAVGPASLEAPVRSATPTVETHSTPAKVATPPPAELKQEEKPMTPEEKTATAFCPQCQLKDLTAQIAERDYKDAVAKLQTERDTLASQLAAEKSKPVPEAAATHPPPTPELFEHWRTCPTCKPQLEERANEIRKNVINDLNQTEVASAMQRLGIIPAPKEIIIQRGK